MITVTTIITIIVSAFVSIMTNYCRCHFHSFSLSLSSSLSELVGILPKVSGSLRPKLDPRQLTDIDGNPRELEPGASWSELSAPRISHTVYFNTLLLQDFFVRGCAQNWTLAARQLHLRRSPWSCPLVARRLDLQFRILGCTGR